jgi:phage portal protein, HK97 family|nr:MAG TPA: portal protein [Caudoviricetes sp.]
MSFWQRIANYFRRETPGGINSGLTRQGVASLFVSNDQTALCVATVFRCVKLLSESVANLPLQYLIRKDGIFTEAYDARLDYLLNVQPDYAVNAFDFWRQVVQELLLDGNAYIVPIYNPVSMELDRLALCERGTVMHDTINDHYDVYDLTTGISGRFSEDEMIHVKGLTLRNSKKGISVLSYARLTMSIAATGDQETQNRFANGGNVRGIVSNDTTVRGFGEYQDKELEKTAENIDARFQGGERIVSVPGQVEFKQISLSSTDMQFLESRKFTVIEICRFFSVPPTFVYADTSSNYKTVEQADVDFLSHTLNPLLRNIEIELRRKLIAPSLCHKYKFKFDRRELFACDLNGMMNYGTKLLQLGTTVNEVRKMNNLTPVDGGDTALVSANLRGINETSLQPPASENKNNYDDNENE